MLLEHKLPRGTKELVKDRIKSIQVPQTVQARPIMPQMVTSTPNAPLDAPHPPARLVGGEVSTGPGTRGPRKF